MDNRMSLIHAFQFSAVRKRADRKNMGFGLAAFLNPLSTSKTMKTICLWDHRCIPEPPPPGNLSKVPPEQSPRLPTHSEPAREKKDYVGLQG